MKRLTIAFILGILFGSFLGQSVEAQRVLVAFGVSSGAIKPISVTSGGAINVAIQ